MGSSLASGLSRALREAVEWKAAPMSYRSLRGGGVRGGYGDSGGLQAEGLYIDGPCRLWGRGRRERRMMP